MVLLKQFCRNLNRKRSNIKAELWEKLAEDIATRKLQKTIPGVLQI
jgi:hypothetical protein